MKAKILLLFSFILIFGIGKTNAQAQAFQYDWSDSIHLCFT
tara:strand:+ start:640 stop:762 length:123 start_codon:yes stop_codon:yes gene_type:complete